MDNVIHNHTQISVVKQQKHTYIKCISNVFICFSLIFSIHICTINFLFFLGKNNIHTQYILVIFLNQEYNSRQIVKRLGICTLFHSIHSLPTILLYFINEYVLNKIMIQKIFVPFVIMHFSTCSTCRIVECKTNIRTLK